MHPSKGLMGFQATQTWQLLNDQYNREFATAMLFLAYAGEADRLGMTNFATLLQNWAKEELDHAQVFYRYLEERDSWPVINDLALKKLDQPFMTPQAIATALSQYQAEVSDYMVAIAHMALTEKDMASFYFIEHFVKDQILEEKKCVEIQDAFDTSSDLLTTDFQLRKINQKYHQSAPVTNHSH